MVKQLILNKIENLIGQLLWYGRKEDEDLPRGRIEQAIKGGEITVEEIVSCFEENLRENL